VWMWNIMDNSLMDNSSDKDNFISNVVISEFLLSSLFRHVLMKLVIILGLLYHSFLTGMSPATWFLWQPCWLWPCHSENELPSLLI
jgi:hypothetical protein